MSGHDHQHGHSHLTETVTESKAFIAGIVLNAVFVIAEVIAGLTTHSLGLLTDAGHNLSDVAGLILSLLAFRLSRRRSTRTFTYGYKKTTVLATLFNAVFLLVAIGVMGLEAARRLARPEPVVGGTMAWVAGLGIIVNTASAMLFYKQGKSELNARGAFLHLMADALVSLAVVVAGIVIAYTHWYWLDPAISFLVLAVILISTWTLLTDSLRLSLDAVPRALDIEKVKALIEAVPGVAKVHHIHIWAISTRQNALTAHLVLTEQDDFETMAKVVAQVKHELQHHNIDHATIELDRPGEINP